MRSRSSHLQDQGPARLRLPLHCGQSGLVRRVALSGENILISPQYQQLAKDGFFISRVLWTSMETTGKGRAFEFEAEFKNAQQPSDFAYQIRGVYERNADGEPAKSRSELSDVEKGKLRDSLETAAAAHPQDSS